MNPIRVLVVDDSTTMRRLICMRLRSDPRLDVVGEASDAAEAKVAITALSPDVLTLDVEMPGQSGLDFLRELMRIRPMPVIMVSSETQKGSAAAVEPLSRGAIECVGKPRSGESGNAFADLPGLVIAAASANLRRRGAHRTDGGCLAAVHLEQQDRADRVFDRRCRCAGNDHRGHAAELPADPDHPAYACQFPVQLRTADEFTLRAPCGAGRRQCAHCAGHHSTSAGWGIPSGGDLWSAPPQRADRVGKGQRAPSLG